MEYWTVHLVRHWIPDDRLVRATIDPSGLITFAYRAWHIHPALVREFAALSDDVALTGILELDLSHQGPPSLTTWVELVPPELQDVPLVPRIGPPTATLPPFLEMQVRRDLIDTAIAREFNEVVLPYVTTILVPSGSVRA